MRGDSIVKFFMPKEERFHDLLARDTENLVKASRIFVEVAASTRLDERTAKKDQLKAIEHEGDLITREIFEALNSTFITPLDREDIAMIAGNLDDILDYMESVAHNLVLFELQESPEPPTFSRSVTTHCVFHGSPIQTPSR